MGLRSSLIISVSILFSLVANADQAPQPIAVNKPFKFRELVQIISDCAVQQAPKMLSQAALDGRTETISKMDRLRELDKGASLWESVTVDGHGLEQITPQARYFSAHWKGCVADYNEIGFSHYGGALIFETSKGRTSDGNDCGGYTYADLVTPDGSVPTVVYDPTDRPKKYNNVGDEQYLDEVVAKVQIVPGLQMAPIRLIQSTMRTPSNVYFDPALYISCLKTKMGVQ